MRPFRASLFRGPMSDDGLDRVSPRREGGIGAHPCRRGSDPNILTNGHDIIRRLLHDGFERVSVRGSHHKFVHWARRRRVIVPHPKKNLPLGTMRAIYRDAGWEKD
jgi:predicted RNA binding protein YcfA (HicA-like mRNA interferase family)